MRINEFLDHELNEVMVHKIEVHLTECAPCLTERDIDAVVKALVARAGPCAAPDGLKQRIMHRLADSRTPVV